MVDLSSHRYFPPGRVPEFSPHHFYDWFNEMEPVPIRTENAIEINQKGQEYEIPDAGKCLFNPTLLRILIAAGLGLCTTNVLFSQPSI